MSGIPRPEPAKIWQKRFYDFNVWTEQKHIEKLRYMHRNPVKRGLVEKPEQWKWSSFRAYLYGETGPVRVNFQEWALEIKSRPAQSFGEVESPLIRKERE
jgi:putative transposase